MRIYVKTIPRASKSEIVRISQGEYKVRLTAPPVNGEANKMLIDVLADYFGVPKKAVSIVGGKSARVKMVEVG